MLAVQQSAPLVSLNAVFNEEHSVNSGFAVDAVKLHSKKAYGMLPLRFDFAVRDSDAYLFRAGYSATVIGVHMKSDLDID